MKTIRDAVLGDIGFDDMELSLIDTLPVQRLRGIKQLGMSSLVFPSAVHSRFEHSLGTCWLTKKILHQIKSTGETIADDDERLVRISALLHDVTHVPFGHTFEDERRLFDRHDENSDRLDSCLEAKGLSRALEATGLKARLRGLLLKNTEEPAYLRQIVMGTVCADLLDYLKRDAFFCGLKLDYDDRLFSCFAIRDGQLVIQLHKGSVFRRDALSELVHLLQMRYALTERVYYHHSKVIAGAMISRAIELAMEARSFNPLLLTELRDDSLLDHLSRGSANVDGVSDLMEDLLTRRLYKRVYWLSLEGFGRAGVTPDVRDKLAKQFHFDTACRRRAERELADSLGIPEAHLIIYCPSPKMQLKEADVPVEVSVGRVQKLSDLGHPDIEALAQKHAGLWRFTVLLRRDHQDKFCLAHERCEEKFGEPNQLDPTRDGSFHFRKG